MLVLVTIAPAWSWRSLSRHRTMVSLDPMLCLLLAGAPAQVVEQVPLLLPSAVGQGAHGAHPELCPAHSSSDHEDSDQHLEEVC